MNVVADDDCPCCTLKLCCTFPVEASLCSRMLLLQAVKKELPSLPERTKPWLDVLQPAAPAAMLPLSEEFRKAKKFSST